MSETTDKNETIARWRYDDLRKANVEGLRIASLLLAHFEGTYTIEEDQVYQELVELSASLAKGLREGTQL